jgi:integrase
MSATAPGLRNQLHGPFDGRVAFYPLDIDMLARIVAALPDDLTAIRDRALLLVGFFCALRRSELVALTVQDLDRRPNGWIVHIQRSKTDP